MTAEESIQLLVKSAHVTPAQMQAVVDTLEAGAARFEAMDWSEQQAFKEVYDTATRLLLVHLEAMDPEAAPQALAIERLDEAIAWCVGLLRKRELAPADLVALHELLHTRAPKS